MIFNLSLKAKRWWFTFWA